MTLSDLAGPDQHRVAGAQHHALLFNSGLQFLGCNRMAIRHRGIADNRGHIDDGGPRHNRWNGFHSMRAPASISQKLFDGLIAIHPPMALRVNQGIHMRRLVHRALDQFHGKAIALHGGQERKARRRTKLGEQKRHDRIAGQVGNGLPEIDSRSYTLPCRASARAARVESEVIKSSGVLMLFIGVR